VNLGRIEDLPPESGRPRRPEHVPLLPSLRAMLPQGIPSRKTQPVRWRYADIRSTQSPSRNC
jgi:gentisate 1,2-dioxygenase